nr:uncharacterized protein CTRU02_02649 [Colletotrichum truncatum]KAF6798675.1 hypothetical protein CTRU02_02649 [Colletotrichum truncatum]
MQFKLSLLALWATIFSGVLANFDVYRVEFRNARGTDIGWQFFEQHSNCDEALDAWSFPQSDDVSGNKIGVRCKGSGCGERPPPGDIEQLEMHFSNNPLWHFSLSTKTGTMR